MLSKISTRLISTINPKVHSNNGIEVQIIADSIAQNSTCSNRNRIVTFSLKYPRFIHAELLTHRMFSRNAASSRAIPVNSMIDIIEQENMKPVHWGKNKKGMSADQEHNELIGISENGNVKMLNREQFWYFIRTKNIFYSRLFSEAGYHKQIVNRILEPYQNIKVILTATEFNNFFQLRMASDAQPEIRELATLMYQAIGDSRPELKREGEWHLPFIDSEVYGICENYIRDNKYDCDLAENPVIDLALKVSSSCCAQVSYRKLDTSIPKALDIHDKLINTLAIHASPFEHQAQSPPYCSVHKHVFNGFIAGHRGFTHVDKYGNLWSGNLKGWIQHRHLIPNNTNVTNIMIFIVRRTIKIRFNHRLRR